VAITYRLKDLAERFGLQLHGDPEAEITAIGSLDNATEGQISFYNLNKFKSSLKTAGAAAVIISEDDLDHCPTNALVSANVYADYARIATLFDNNPAPAPGIHPAASVADSAQIPASASVAANAVIEDEVRLGEGVVVGPGAVIGVQSVIGDQCRIAANVTICHAVTLGKRVIVHPGAVIGSDGFGLAMDEGRWIKVPQLGGVVIGDDCEIGATTTIDRGAIGDTVLEEDVRLDNHIQIAHNVYIGAHTAMAGCAAIAGSVKIGKYCQFGGNSGVVGQVEVTDNVTVLARTLLTRSIREPGVYAGYDAQPNAEWRRNLARLKKLDSLIRRFLKLEKDFEEIKKS
jgi:UDP-3-O-[3-hydroxymyristoyl] glucosamine N-acyltransferase